MPEINSALFLEIEATPGVAETPAGSNAIDVTKNEWTLVEGNPLRRAVVRFHQDRPANSAPAAGRYWKIDLEGEVKASTGATTPPEIDGILRCSGHTRTIGGSSVSYALSNDPVRTKVSCTLTRNDAIGGPRSYVASGVQFGDLTFSYDPNGVLMWSCTGYGRYTRPAAVETSVAVSDYNAGDPLSQMSTVTGLEYMGEDQWVVSKLGWKVGNEVKLRPCLNAGSSDFGYKWPANIVRGAQSPVTWEFEAEPIAEGTIGIFAALEAGTVSELLLAFVAGSRSVSATIGGTTMDAPGIQTSGTDPVLYQMSGCGGRVGTTPAHVITFA